MDALLASLARVEEQGTMRMDRDESRVLLADGDGLAYNCAGRDDTDPAQARINLIDKLTTAARASGSGATRILLTARGSHKGYRYAVARRKPYQGQRSSGRRPKNWEYLRTLLEGGALPFTVDPTATAEADDLFGRWSRATAPERTVIFTEDKDMNMVPGWHLDWNTYVMTYLPADGWCIPLPNGKCLGRKWFWLQMLMGDGADYIPGLPSYIDPKGKTKLCGEVTAGKLLADTHDNASARAVVEKLYTDFYGPTWATEYLEQAVLLWMRQDIRSHWMDVLTAYAPLFGFNHEEAFRTIAARVDEAKGYECSPS